MNRRKNYRRFLLWCLGLDMLIMGWMGYRYLDRKIPDEIHVTENGAQEVRRLLDHPFLEFEETIQVSGCLLYTSPSPRD